MKIFNRIIAAMLLCLAFSCGTDDFPVPEASFVADFTTDVTAETFAPAEVTFTNTSIIPRSENETSFIWNFGDGNTSTERNPVHTYDEPGTYRVRLVLNAPGTVTARERNINIRDASLVGSQLFFGDRVSGSIFSGIIEEGVSSGSVFELSGSPLAQPFSLAVDVSAQKLYMADREAGIIFRANFDGTGRERFREGLDLPTGLAVDEQNGMLYWASDDAVNRTALSNSDLSAREEFATLGAADDIEGVAVDPDNGRVYWIAYFGDLHSKNMDGTNERVLAELVEGAGIAYFDNKIYFHSFQGSGNHTVRAINADGSGSIETVAAGIRRDIYGIAIDPNERIIYWTDQDPEEPGGIRRANLDGSNVADWFGPEPQLRPYGLAIAPENE
ncbi:MAG: PKD domain-containing protein [Cyclobacteriaceae bacterium]|nr:PKD domain-containing protein [Cyclobacteriaceae bacterium]